MNYKVETLYPVVERFEKAVLQSLLGTARLRFGDVKPCGGKTWGECLTVLPDGRRALWFNDAAHSTHMEIA